VHTEHKTKRKSDLFVTSLIIPTGIHASVGGYLGDATPFSNQIAAISDYVVTNPNTVNGGVLNLMSCNTVYTEGTVMDMFFRGETALKVPDRQNGIGVVVERTVDKGAIALIRNTINAIRAVGGIDVVGIEMTDKPIGAHAYVRNSIAHGDVNDLSQFDNPIRKLLKKGANTIALSAEIKADRKLWEVYFKGKGPNPVGALEAVISHYVVDKYRIPAAHAPLVREKDWPMNLKNKEVFWRAAAEAISPAYLGSVLIGLSAAPQLSNVGSAGAISVDDISALVIPYTACGGIPVFECMKRGIPIIAVKEIKTSLNVTPESIGIDAIPAKTMKDALQILERIRRR
jgi:hypothetical protein